jgi:diadenosine tetraphosphate (Ap4A) HIT family hydrolase
VGDCIFCRRTDADIGLLQVWEDGQWPLLADLAAEVAGFCLLVPRRHVVSLGDLDGEDARTFGPVLARTVNALKATTDSKVVYVYIFGTGVPHLHVHLAPHRPGDALNDQMIRGAITIEQLPGGAGRQVSKDFPPRPETELREIAERVRQRLL